MRDWFLEQMAMYAAYHEDKRNQATHHLGVPLIVFSLLTLAAKVTILTLAGGPVTLAAALLAALMLVYIWCAPLVGSLAVLFYGVLLLLAEWVASTLPSSAFYLVFAGLFVGGWIIQFIGHAFEGRRPALFDNLLQVFMAPAFLLAEILFVFGLEDGLRREMARRMPRYLPADDDRRSATDTDGAASQA